MKITFLTPRVHAERFSGGIYCIFKYAQGLVERGHEVTVVAYPRSVKPAWVHYTGVFVEASPPPVNWFDSRERRRGLIQRYTYRHFRQLDENARRGLLPSLLAAAIPPSDVIVSTFWETTATAFACGKGMPVYFMQHFESVFYEPSELAYYQAESTYLLPVFKIANSSWLRERVKTFATCGGREPEIALCVNAVDLEYYHPNPSVDKLTRHDHELNLISYGGRQVKWKGFREMAEAVRLARQQLPDIRIHWNVYGEADLPPDNPVAPYHALGFLKPAELARAYQRNDVLLSASWYESFPLFPIEAMACGLAVITTAPGTEDYAVHGTNALVVEPQNPVSVAAAIVALARSPALRAKLAAAGAETAKRFSWDLSVQRLEALLLQRLGGAGHPPGSPQSPMGAVRQAPSSI